MATSLLGSGYNPPGVYTQTLFESPVTGGLDTLKIPVIVGEGAEILTQTNLGVIRGSSSTVDQRLVDEDETGRAVVSVSQTGVVTLGAFDGVLERLQVRHYPIVTGAGTGITTTARTDVSVTINGLPIVVRAVAGATGIVQLAQAPAIGDLVRVSYYFKRTDTLITDDVSDQVPNRQAVVRAVSGIYDSAVGGTATVVLHADILDNNGWVTVAANNVLLLTVDGVASTLTIPPGTYTMAQVASAINALGVETLTAGTFVNQYGHSALVLYTDYSLAVGAGSANGLLGLIEGQADNRTVTFYTFNGPIVKGDNGGVTTTDPSYVTVRVAGHQVIPTSVDGSTRAVTLPQAPIAGATVTITYYFNTWQDTFDYLLNVGVTEVTKCGYAQDSNSYVQGTDFVLQDDKILWGTAVAVENGVTTSGYTAFGTNQVTATLVDYRSFLTECTPVVSQSGGLATEDRLNFTLPFQPTLGNGRNTPLGTSLFQTVSNGRIDLPVNRPDVVWVYWGFGIDDALTRGRVEVINVEGETITLADPVEVGATVYATIFYNTLADEEFTLTVVTPGVSGVGTYTVQDEAEDYILLPKYNSASKGSSLTGITLEFPSGTELLSDVRLEPPIDTTDYTGPVEEIVTVQFASRVATPARFTFPGAGPYEFIPSQSDHLSIRAHSITLNAAGIDLESPSAIAAHVNGYFACLISDEIHYEGGAGVAPGLGYDIDGETFTLGIDKKGDGSDIDVAVQTQTVASATIANFVDAINEAAGGHYGLFQAGSSAAVPGANTAVLRAAAPSIPAAHDHNDYYVGWKIVIGTGGAATAGFAYTVTDYVAATQTATITPDWNAATPPVAPNKYYIYNPATRAYLKGTTKFDSPYTVLAAKVDDLSFVYRGDVSGTTTVKIAAIAAGTYGTATALATAVDTALGVVIGTLVGFDGLDVECTANSESQLQFQLQLPGIDSAGYLQFIKCAANDKDFGIQAGLVGTASAVTEDYSHAALIQGPVAWAKTCITGGDRLYDRLLIRNRVLPGVSASLAQDAFVDTTAVKVKSDNTHAGLTTGMASPSGAAAVAHAATLYGAVSLVGGQHAVSGEPVVTFYNGLGIHAANNTFNFEIDGYSVNVAFTASSGGTALGPISGASNGSILDQIIDAMSLVAGYPFGGTDAATAAAAIYAAFLVRQEGIGIRLMSSRTDSASSLVIKSGSAVTVLGFTGSLPITATRSLTSVDQVAAALMSDVEVTTFLAWVTNPASSDANHFGNYAIATKQIDETGAEYLYLQDLPALQVNLGAASNISVLNTTGGLADALRYTTGLGAISGNGGVGDAAVSGFFVLSNDTVHGSGTINTSMLNPDAAAPGVGWGQDGVVGQTYRDLITGLTFTILPRGWQTDPVGPWVAYPTGANATFRINVTQTYTTNANISHNALPGVELVVANTYGAAVGDTGIVSTFERAGASTEPTIGSEYYVTYNYVKPDFSTAFYSKMSTIERVYGAVNPDNPVSLAAYLAILNGAVLVGIKQVLREEGQSQASITTYRDAIDELEGVLPGQVQPDIITLMRTDSTSLYQYLKRSCEIQSSIRYKAERTAILGTTAGTTPDAVQTLAQNITQTRMRLVYPDMVTLDIQDAYGNNTEYLVEGSYLASALMGSVVSPNYDVATPWTGRRLVGFTQLARQLDAVQQNQIAVKGVTILVDQSPYVKVRHGLTTDMTNTLTKLPTIIQIADEVQRQSRAVLENFIGIKFLPGVLGQIEGRLSMMLKDMVTAQIITAYTGVKATVDPVDATACNVSAYYSPVFPLLYIVVTFSVRSSL